jgi:ribosomal protein L7/L12
MAAPAPTAAPVSAAAAEVEVPKEAPTQFKITLQKFDAASKAKVIKEIKSMLPGANLVEVLILNNIGQKVC